jgi:general nucleoside transport system ATP-binding protein
MIELEARAVSRAFGERVAVRGASIRLRPGTLHAVVGENGAGKSTLLKMLAGAVRPSAGEVLVGGRPLAPFDVREAIARGVGLVYQHFALVPGLTALENLMLGDEPAGPFGILRPEDLRARVEDVERRTGMSVPLDVRVSRLGVGERQRLEIVRVLVRGAKALLLDEPTAVLTPGESDALYALLRSLVRSGSTVAVVTHHLEEVVAHADEVTVMRRGEIVHHAPASSADVDTLARIALGEIMPASPMPPVAASAVARLSIEGLSSSGAAGRPLDAFSVTLREGEIVGIAGVDGNGQDALVLGLAGLVPASGKIVLGAHDLSTRSVADRRRLGLETVHADRHRHSLVLGATVGENLVLGDLGVPDERSLIAKRLAASRVDPPDASALAGSLSGGNQQKLVMARALDREPKALVLAHPTRGVDAGAAAFLRTRIREAAAASCAVLLVSGDLAELRALSHRLLVLFGGKVVAELPADAPEDVLGRAMLGAA